MIAEKKTQSQNKENTTKLNTIKQFTKDIVTRTIFRKKFPTMLFENNARKFKLKFCTTVINSVNIVCLK